MSTQTKPKKRHMDRLASVLNREKGGTPHTILPAIKRDIDAIKRDIDAFVGEAPQFDDITMLCLAYKARMEKKEEDAQ